MTMVIKSIQCAGGSNHYRFRLLACYDAGFYLESLIPFGSAELQLEM